MNKKIKIFLQETGSTAIVDIGFRIYQGSYKATDIELYVPADLIQTTEVIGTTVSIAGIEIDETGKTYNTRVYYLVDPIDVVIAGMVYKKYTRGLPSTFTKYAGTTTVVANVVQVNSSDLETPLVEAVITSQRVDIPIEHSKYIEETEIIEPDDLTAIYAELAKKQNIAEPTLTTTNKTIPTAINELKSGVDENTEDIAQNTTDISSNTSRIVALENQAITGKTYIGDMSGSALPTDSQLTAFVEQTIEREPKNGDTINFTLVVSGATDVQYEYTYTASGWKGVPRPTMESASNTDKGIIKGTYQQGVDYAIQVDIAGGEIKNIYFENNDGNLTGLKYYVNANDTAIKNIINGTTKVGKALNADNDSDGNNIIATYQTQTSGASKTYVKNYALPREFNDIYFFVANGYQKEAPTGTTPIKTKTVTTPTETELFRFSKNETASYELSSKNSAYTKICIEASENCSVYFKLVTQITQGGQTYTLSEETTNLTNLIAEEITKIVFDDAFTSLGDTLLSIDNNATITQILKVITGVYDSIIFSMYSGTGYPSTMALNTQLAVVMQGGEVEQIFDPTSSNAQSGKAVAQAISTKEDVDNKVSNWTGTPSNARYPSEKLVKDSLDTKSSVRVDMTGTSTNEAKFITVNGTEWKLAGGGLPLRRLGGYDPVFANNSWGAIKRACQNNEIPETWEIGDLKTFQGTDGLEYTVRLSDKQQGRYAYTNGGSTNAVFELVEAVDTTSEGSPYQWNSTRTNADGYAESLLRTTMNTDILGILPDEIKNLLEEVNIKSSTGGATYSGQSTSANKIFALAYNEVAQTTETQYTQETANNDTVFGMLDYYELHTEDSYKVKRVWVYYQGEYVKGTCDWWLRSPCELTTDNAMRVQNSGEIYETFTNSELYASFAWAW